MNETDLNSLLKRTAWDAPRGLLPSSDGELKKRLQYDDGRARRWRFFVRLLLTASLLTGIVTAILVCWWLATQDKTHTTPPTMELFREVQSQ
jgi:hypothetical protein